MEIKNKSILIKNIKQEDLNAEQKELLSYSFVQYASFDILALFYYTFITINSDNLKGAKGKLRSDIEGKNIKTILYYNFILKSLSNLMKDELNKNNSLVYSVWYKSKDSYGQMKDKIATEIKKLSETEKEKLKY